MEYNRECLPMPDGGLVAVDFEPVEFDQARQEPLFGIIHKIVLCIKLAFLPSGHCVKGPVKCVHVYIYMACNTLQILLFDRASSMILEA